MKLSIRNCMIGLLGVLVTSGPFGVNLGASTLQGQRPVATGDPKALDQMGQKYQENHDFTQAAQWYLKAAVQGNSEAMVHLAFLYEQGRGVKQDYREAGAWYRKAANLGDPTAMFYLGVLSWAGRGFERNFVEAYAWFDLAASRTSGSSRERNLNAQASLERILSSDQVSLAKKRAQDLQSTFERSKK